MKASRRIQAVKESSALHAAERTAVRQNPAEAAAIEAVRAEVEGTMTRTAFAIAQLCNAAGHPARTAGFLARRASVDEVRRELGLTGSKPGITTNSKSNASGSWDQAFEAAEQIDRFAGRIRF